MRKKTPPHLAVLLLELFAGNEPLAGDLEEEYRAGRSRTWYWRQVAATLLVSPTGLRELLRLAISVAVAIPIGIAIARIRVRRDAPPC